ncbi:MAG: flotillin family protein, partial [Actinomycetota bacterium]
TVISTDGASEVTKNAANTVTQGLQLASDVIGVDLAELFRSLAGQQAEQLTPPADSTVPAEH